MSTVTENLDFVADYGGIKRAYQTSITDVSDTNLEGHCTIRWEGRNAYKWVQYVNDAYLESNTSSVAAVSGYACRYYHKKGGGPNKGIVTCSNPQSIIYPPAGLLISAPSDGQYCWIQIKGYGNLAPGVAGTGTRTLSMTMNKTSESSAPNPGILYDCLNPLNTTSSWICAYLISHKVDGGDGAKIICDFPF